MKEMEEDYKRDEKAKNDVTSREVFITIGMAMDEDQPGRAPPTVLEKGKGPLIAQRSCLLRLTQCSSRRNSTSARATTAPQTCCLRHLRLLLPKLLQLIE